MEIRSGTKKNMAYEKNLRKWFKSVWCSAPITWVEPGLGSTAGQPDALSFVAIGTMAEELRIELKAGHLVAGKARLKVRPAQVRYHLMARRQGLPSFVLAALDEDKAGATPSIWLWPGYQVVDLRAGFLVADDPWRHGFVVATELDRHDPEHSEALHRAVTMQWERWYGGLDRGVRARWE